MNPSYLLAIDQGTTSSKASLVDEHMQVAATGSSEFAQHYPKPGWVEHSADEIWASVVRAIGAALASSKVTPSQIVGIGITNQRETTLLWDRATSAAIGPAIVWQCRRTAELCRQLRAAGHSEWVRDETGLVIDAYFSATKIRWLLDNLDGIEVRAKNGEIAFGTVDSFLAWKLTGGAAHVTDVSNASRTLLMGLQSQQWDPRLLELFGVPSEMMPEIRGSAEIYGTTKGVPGLPDGIPVAGMAGDQQAALFGQACFEPGEGKITYGTGSFLLVNTGGEPVASRQGMVTTVAWRVGERTHYALEGSAFIAGAAVQWLRDNLGIIETASDIEALAAQVPDSDGVVFVPAFVGLGAPHWHEQARAALLHLTRGTTRAHIARACLEGIALQNADIIRAMEADRGGPVARMKVDGGACVNNLLMQLQADVSGRDMIRPQNTETTSLGAALLAGLGVGMYSGLDDIRSHWKEERVFRPNWTHQRRERSVARWLDAVGRVASPCPTAD